MEWDVHHNLLFFSFVRVAFMNICQVSVDCTCDSLCLDYWAWLTDLLACLDNHSMWLGSFSLICLKCYSMWLCPAVLYASISWLHMWLSMSRFFSWLTDLLVCLDKHCMWLGSCSLTCLKCYSKVVWLF